MGILAAITLFTHQHELKQPSADCSCVCVLLQSAKHMAAEVCRDGVWINSNLSLVLPQYSLTRVQRCVGMNTAEAWIYSDADSPDEIVVQALLKLGVLSSIPRHLPCTACRVAALDRVPYWVPQASDSHTLLTGMHSRGQC